jgi:hypothetical protein
MRVLVVAAVVVCQMVMSACGGAAAVEDPFEGLEVRSITTEEWNDLLAEAHEPSFTQADVDAWMPEVVAAVERFTGRTLDAPPVVRVVTRAELTEVMDAELLSPEYTVWRESLAEDYSAYLDWVDRVEGHAGGSFGFDTSDGSGYLLAAENVPGLLRFAGRPSAPVDGVVRLWLAGHVVDRLVDQEVGPIEVVEDEDDLTRVLELLRSIEAIMAARDGYRLGVIVGLADELASREALAAILAFRTTYVARGNGSESEWQREEGRRRFKQMRDGYAFMRSVAPEADADRAWEVLASPPRSMAEIFDPSLYTAGRWAWPGDDVVFGELRAVMKSPAWRIDQGDGSVDLAVSLWYLMSVDGA